MNTKQETGLEKLNEDVLKLILPYLKPSDFFNMNLVCKSWNEYLADGKTGKDISKILDSKPAWYEQIMGNVNTKEHPWLFFLTTNLFALSIIYQEVLHESLSHSFLKEPIPTFAFGLCNMCINVILGMVGLELSHDSGNMDELNTRILEASSIGSLVMAMYFYIGPKMNGGILGSLIGSAATLFTIAISGTSGEILNKYSFFCRNKPGELHNAISKLLKGDTYDASANSEHVPKLQALIE